MPPVKKNTLAIDEYRKLEAAAMSEDELLGYVINCAKVTGWMVCHFRPGRTAHGWTTPIQGHKGYPDLTLVRGTTVFNSRLIFAELKREGKDPKPEQQEWLDCLKLLPWVEVHVWRPHNWLDGTVQKCLEG